MDQIRIQYCRPCGLKKNAEQLADRLREIGDFQIELVPGNLGVFKVWRNGELVFDKRRAGGWLAKLGIGPVPPIDQILPLVLGPESASRRA